MSHIPKAGDKAVIEHRGKSYEVVFGEPIPAKVSRLAIKRTQPAKEPSMTELNLPELRKIAEAATPGPWRVYGLAGVTSPELDLVPEQHVNCDCGNVVAMSGCVEMSDAHCIATFDPPTVLALLDEIERLTTVTDAQVEAAREVRE